MKLISVKSSNVVAVGHSGTTLTVQYKNGTYQYDNVSRSVFDSLLAAESKGRFMNAEIKGKYSYKKIS